MQRRELLKTSTLLLGAGVSASLARAVLAGVEASPGASSAKFSEAWRRTVELLCDMIIPTTDTPGATEAGVPDFVASIVFDWYTAPEQIDFFDGLRALDQHCLASEQLPFHEASEANRVAALQAQAQIAGHYQPAPTPFGPPAEDPNAPFFSKIKALVVLGYYTSEVGATRELIYMPVPGEYKGDVDFAEVGRQWTY